MSLSQQGLDGPIIGALSDMAAIEHSIKADHGYNLDSRSVRNLIEVMSSYNKDERRRFLQL